MEQAVNPSDSLTDLSAAATAIFGGVSNQVMLKSLGREVTIRPASMKQLPIVLDFFRSIMSGLDQEAIGALVELIADKQVEAIRRGEDPNKISVEELTGVTLVGKAVKNVSLLTMVLSSALESLPRAVPAFTNVTEDEYGDLPPDEGMLLAGGIFMVNYSFFTQSLPPLLTAFMRSWASKNLPAPSKKTAGRTK